jgi:hypothetical protein
LDEYIVKVQAIGGIVSLTVGGEDCDIFFWNYGGKSVDIEVLLCQRRV